MFLSISARMQLLIVIFGDFILHQIIEYWSTDLHSIKVLFNSSGACLATGVLIQPGLARSWVRWAWPGWWPVNIMIITLYTK